MLRTKQFEDSFQGSFANRTSDAFENDPYNTIFLLMDTRIPVAYLVHLDKDEIETLLNLNL